MTGRNDPCPCGSGKKYKKCHLDADRAGSARSTEPVSDMDGRLVNELLRFGEQRFDRDWIADSLDPWTTDAAELLLRWLAWTAMDGGTTLAERFFSRNSASLTLREREWFAAQREARLGIWTILEIADERVKLRDLFTNEVHDVRLEDPLHARPDDAVLARVVPFEGVSFFSGFDPRPLSPVVASAIAQETTSREAPAIFTLWDEGAELLDDVPVVFADEETVDLFIDDFSFAPVDEAEIEWRLSKIDSLVDHDFNDEGEHQYEFTDEEGIIGLLYLGEDYLSIITATPGLAADVLVPLVETACAGLLRDHEQSTGKARTKHPIPASEWTPEMLARFREKKEQRYRECIDDSRDGGKVQLLLKELAWREAKATEEERVDVAALARELGVEDEA